jgi:hypothetical protein
MPKLNGDLSWLYALTAGLHCEHGYAHSSAVDRDCRRHGVGQHRLVVSDEGPHLGFDTFAYPGDDAQTRG